MKKTLILILICSAQSIFSQTETNLTESVPDTNSYANEMTPISDDKIYNIANIEVKPEFPGGAAAFNRFIKENYKITDPEASKGTIIVSFIIEKDGSLSDIKIMKDIGYGSGREAYRVFQKSPKWIPGEQNGKKIRVEKSITINL